MSEVIGKPQETTDGGDGDAARIFLAETRGLIATRVCKAVGFAALAEQDVEQLLPGKMLRSRLAARLVEGGLPVDLRTLRHFCAATELVHTASLCHDDVVDNAILRRARLALWQSTGPSTAILIGDLLLCEALELVMQVENGLRMGLFVSRVREVIRTEVAQELLLRGRPMGEGECIQVARGKTGPLFALVAEVCGGDDRELAASLAEAGYRIGTAYQLADDLLDVVGDEEVAGKTLGTDSVRGKFTLPMSGRDGGRATRRRVSEMCEAALGCLDAWREARRAVAAFLRQDLQPVLDQHVDVCMGLAE